MGRGTHSVIVKQMKCICCQFDRFRANPIGLKGYYRCLHCGLLFKIQREDNRDKIAEHYQKADPHWRVADSKLAFFQFALKHISLHFKNRRGILLDVGCGFGYFLDLAEKNMWKTQGVEIVNYALNEYDQKKHRLNIYQGSLKDAKYSDNYFDVATLWDVLVFVEKPSNEIEECFRIGFGMFFSRN